MLLRIRSPPTVFPSRAQNFTEFSSADISRFDEIGPPVKYRAKYFNNVAESQSTSGGGWRFSPQDTLASFFRNLSKTPASFSPANSPSSFSPPRAWM